MNRRHRLTNRSDFQRVRREGKSYAHPLAILIAAPNGGCLSRFGIVAGKRVGNAVTRNRAKRRLRETIRTQLPQMASGWDVIIIARPAISDGDWTTIVEGMRNLLRRADLLRR
jgi:ribonuclease P protein component